MQGKWFWRRNTQKLSLKVKNTLKFHIFDCLNLTDVRANSGKNEHFLKNYSCRIE